MGLFHKLFSSSSNKTGTNMSLPTEINPPTKHQVADITHNINPNPFPEDRYNNLDDLFNNIYCGCSKEFSPTEKERNFINQFINRLSNEQIPCECLLSRLSNGELIVYYKSLEVGRIKFNGNRNYMVVYAKERRQYEAKTDNFYLLKMNYWIDSIKYWIAHNYI